MHKITLEVPAEKDGDNRKTGSNFIQQSLNSGSAQVQMLLAACRRFAMLRISDNGPFWKQGQTPFVSQPYHKNNSSSSSSKGRPFADFKDLIDLEKLHGVMFQSGAYENETSCRDFIDSISEFRFKGNLPVYKNF